MNLSKILKTANKMIGGGDSTFEESFIYVGLIIRDVTIESGPLLELIQLFNKTDEVYSTKSIIAGNAYSIFRLLNHLNSIDGFYYKRYVFCAPFNPKRVGLYRYGFDIYGKITKDDFINTLEAIPFEKLKTSHKFDKIIDNYLTQKR